MSFPELVWLDSHPDAINAKNQRMLITSNQRLREEVISLQEANVRLSKALADAEAQRDSVTRALADAQETLKDALTIREVAPATHAPVTLPDSMSDTEHYARWARSMLS